METAFNTREGNLRPHLPHGNHLSKPHEEPPMTARKKDLLSYSDFSRLMPETKGSPGRDSPGDSNDDRVTEILVGMDYGEESEDDLRDPLEGEVADDLLETEKIGGETRDLLDEDERVVDSDTPEAP